MVNLVEVLGRGVFDSLFYSFIGAIVMIAAYFDIRDKSYPPGPLGMPIFGYLPMLNPKTPYNTLKELASHYGKVFGLHLGSVYTVVISDVKLIREALNMPSFHSPAPLQMARDVTQGKGILVADDDRWKQHRFFLMNALRSLQGSPGGKSAVESKIQAALSEFASNLREQGSGGKPVEPALRHSIGSMMMDVVTGLRPQKGDASWNKLQQQFTHQQLQMMSITDSNNFVPLLKKFGKYGKAMQGLLSGQTEATKLYQKCVDKYPTPSAENMNSLVEAYLAEASRNKPGFTPEQVAQVLLDTLSMGWTTTLDSLHWLYIYLAMHPECQQLIVKEMEQHLGSRRASSPITLEQCQKLTYTQAVIMEVWRHRPVLPMGVPHCAAESTKIGKYTIRQGTLVVPLIYAVHRDQRYWDKPDDFTPERHLEDDGSLRKSDYFIPFQTGHKSCVGEQLAQSAILLFLVGILKEFSVSFPSGVAFSQDDLPDFAVTAKPPTYPLCFSPRR